MVHRIDVPEHVTQSACLLKGVVQRACSRTHELASMLESDQHACLRAREPACLNEGMVMHACFRTSDPSCLVKGMVQNASSRTHELACMFEQACTGCIFLRIHDPACNVE
jgi:hypothetical protein